MLVSRESSFLIDFTPHSLGISRFFLTPPDAIQALETSVIMRQMFTPLFVVRYLSLLWKQPSVQWFHRILSCNLRLHITFSSTYDYSRTICYVYPMYNNNHNITLTILTRAVAGGKTWCGFGLLIDPASSVLWGISRGPLRLWTIWTGRTRSIRYVQNCQTRCFSFWVRSDEILRR